MTVRLGVPSKHRVAAVIGTLAIVALVTSRAAADAADPSLADLGRLSIEDLANIAVTSVSKRPEPLSAAAAAVYVITADDIRRAGATSLQEALRLAPNLEVARINAFDYTITARGFNSPESSNKLLVLIDGRSVYSPLASTVFWQALDVPVADIERIEVISGPGGTLYGANAVNGVINVITRSSKDTQGLMLDLGAGSAERTGTVRYGGAIGDLATFRAYVTGFNRNDTSAALAGDTTRDGVNGVQGGFRADGGIGRDTYTLQGDLYGNRVTDDFESLWGGNLLARWGHGFDDGSALSITAYWDKDDRDAPFLMDRLESYDLQAQHTFAWGSAQQIVWGGEYRAWREGLFSSDAFFFAKPWATVSLGNAFGQDEIALPVRLKLTLGLKIEENSYSGLDLLPNVRLAWQQSPDTLFWAAVSRSVRTPSRVDRELMSPGLLIAAPDFDSEKLIAYELGYRGRLFSGLSLSVSAFYNSYTDLRTDALTAGGLPIQLQNGLNADTFGIEAWADYDLTAWWRLHAGINTLHKDLRLDPGETDISLFQSAGQDPPYQAQLRSSMNIAPDWALDLALRDVGHVVRPFMPAPVTLVPGYFEADARIGWHVLQSLELSVDGYNLLHDRHLEVYDPSSYAPRDIGRSVLVSLRTAL